MFQSVVVKVSDAGDTEPSLESRLETATVTAAEGRVASRTGNVAIPPASVAWPLTAPGRSPGSFTNTGRPLLLASDPSTVVTAKALSVSTMTRLERWMRMVQSPVKSPL